RTCGKRRPVRRRDEATWERPAFEREAEGVEAGVEPEDGAAVSAARVATTSALVADRTTSATSARRGIRAVINILQPHLGACRNPIRPWNRLRVCNVSVQACRGSIQETNKTRAGRVRRSMFDAAHDSRSRSE